MNVTSVAIALILFMPVAAAAGMGESLAQDIISESQIMQAKVNMTVESKSIILSVNNDKGEKFHIYSITGQLVKTVTVPAKSEERIELKCGCYIVKCSQWSKKVMVK